MAQRRWTEGKSLLGNLLSGPRERQARSFHPARLADSSSERSDVLPGPRDRCTAVEHPFPDLADPENSSPPANESTGKDPRAGKFPSSPANGNFLMVPGQPPTTAQRAWASGHPAIRNWIWEAPCVDSHSTASWLPANQALFSNLSIRSWPSAGLHNTAENILEQRSFKIMRRPTSKAKALQDTA